MSTLLTISEASKFATLKKCGFDACDFSVEGIFNKTRGKFADIYNVSNEQIIEHFTSVREEAQKVGFEIGQVHGECSGHFRDYSYDLEDMVKRQIASIKATHYLGCKLCVTHPLIMRGRRHDMSSTSVLKIRSSNTTFTAVLKICGALTSFTEPFAQPFFHEQRRWSRCATCLVIAIRSVSTQVTDCSRKTILLRWCEFAATSLLVCTLTTMTVFLTCTPSPSTVQEHRTARVGSRFAWTGSNL